MAGIRSRKEPRDFLGLFLYTKELHMNNYVYTTVEEQIEKLKKTTTYNYRQICCNGKIIYLWLL